VALRDVGDALRDGGIGHAELVPSGACIHACGERIERLEGTRVDAGIVLGRNPGDDGELADHEKQERDETHVASLALCKVRLPDPEAT
jgi:hypothetical protein